MHTHRYVRVSTYVYIYTYTYQLALDTLAEMNTPGFFLGKLGFDGSNATSRSISACSRNRGRVRAFILGPRYRVPEFHLLLGFPFVFRFLL